MSSDFNINWFKENIKNEFDAVLFLQKFGVIPETKFCDRNHKMKMNCSKTKIFWRCQHKVCTDFRTSVRSGTWFQGSKLSLETLILFIYSWSQESTSLKYCQQQFQISTKTIIDYNNFLREVCASTLLNQPRSIGGEGKIVEIDYTYFTMRKNEEGKMVPDQWVFGGICRETEEVFLCTFPEITEDTITECIKNNIEPETTIISDCQPSYKNIKNIQDYNYKHLMVNDSENLVDPALNANLQSIENIWFSLNERNKKHCGTSRKMLDSYLSEFVWRRRYANKDLFINMLKDIASFQSSKNFSSSLNIKPGNSGKEKGRKRKRNNSEENSKLQDNESSLQRVQLTNNMGIENVEEAPSTSGVENLCVVLPPDPLQLPDDNYNEDIKLYTFRSRENSSGNTLVQAVHDNLHPLSHFSQSPEDFKPNVFDLFGKSVSNRLNNMPQNSALQLRLKIEELLTNFRLQKSFSTLNDSSVEVPPICDEKFIDIKMEINDDFSE